MEAGHKVKLMLKWNEIQIRFLQYFTFDLGKDDLNPVAHDQACGVMLKDQW